MLKLENEENIRKNLIGKYLPSIHFHRSTSFLFSFCELVTFLELECTISLRMLC